MRMGKRMMIVLAIAGFSLNATALTMTVAGHQMASTEAKAKTAAKKQLPSGLSKEFKQAAADAFAELEGLREVICTENLEAGARACGSGVRER